MARYTIEDIISAVQAGEVTEQQAAGDLSRLGKYQESSQSSKETKLKMKLTFVDLSIASNKNNPEAVLLERERLTELLELWQRMETALTARQLEILKAYLQCGKNTMAAARSPGISQPVIFKTIKSVRQKLQNRFGIRLKAFKEILLLPQIAQEAQKALGVGQPFEQEMKLAVGSSWQTRFGRKVFKTQTACHMPEYLHNTNSDSVCTLCGKKCSRREMRTERPLLQPWKKDRLEQIIAANRVS